MTIFQAAKDWARRIKRDSVTLWFAYRDPATPLLVKGLCIFIVAYALSPIDLIPDFIPVLGYLGDVVLLPGLIWLAVRLVPAAVLSTSREKGDAWLREQGSKPRSYWGAALVLSIWALALYFIWRWFVP